jgi:hypothetical protein
MPVQLIWAQVKGYVTEKNNNKSADTSKLAHMKIDA